MTINIKLVSNENNGILNFFKSGLVDSTNFDWASAYASDAAFSLVSNEFKDFLKKGGKSRAIFDLAQGLTDPKIIEELTTIPGDSECKVFVGDNTTSGIFHHKFYNLYNTKGSRLLMGSANFTKNALTVNSESALITTFDATEDLYQDAIDLFEQSIWQQSGAVSPFGNPKILGLYNQIYTTRQNFQSKLTNQLNSLKEAIQDHHTYLENYQNFNPFVAYLCGALCANAKYNTLDTINNNRTIYMHFQSQKNNRNTEDEGFLCTRIDGILLGGIRLEQIPTQVESMKRLTERLKYELSRDADGNQVIMENRSSLITNVRIVIKFSEESNVWNHISNCFNEFIVSQDSSLIPTIPTQVLKSDDREIMRKFIEGYFDFRALPSRGHMLPDGRMRIGVQIDTKAFDFAESLRSLLFNLNVTETQISDGTARGRDNILRIMPDNYTDKLFQKGWKRLMAQSYTEYNENFG
tara:strand:+ start:26922 stop:28319 length:1398 start_codon:yes stop_codon:yes gene_type:complete